MLTTDAKEREREKAKICRSRLTKHEAHNLHRYTSPTMFQHFQKCQRGNVSEITNQLVKTLKIAFFTPFYIENTYTCSAVSTTGASDNVGCDRPGTFPPNLNRRSIFYFVLFLVKLFSKISKCFNKTKLGNIILYSDLKILFYTLRHQ